MIITCPHCQTKYQVTYEAIGSAGRKVQCAHCHQAWTQDAVIATQSESKSKGGVTTEDDKLFEAIAEDALDEAMRAEEGAVSTARGRVATAPEAPLAPPGVDAAALKKRQAEFSRRQHAIVSRLPMARLRRAARISGVLILASLLGSGYYWRVPIVERYPDLAGLYEAVGLGVNVVGLEFDGLETLKSLSGGNDVLTVSAQIIGRSPRPVPVPPVVVSLLDASGHAVYEWSVAPRVRDLMTGERATFDTRLSLPPSEAERVKLSFANRGATPERGAAPGSGAPTHAAPVPQAGAPVEHTTPAAPTHPPTGDHAPAASDHTPAAEPPPAAAHH
ncbi:zinc-ribbon domain-containing protein [uncultured Devosia sp.]|uniref:zinc-ribbon domain-containing protein n=1 Tax=uncultured Devosia sp. TaxID=211434 RepID=UPI002638492F|nr:zinc-ribbon domain-containing protein [uncultured Devosia sp.]